jgi:hypothetical protein
MVTYCDRQWKERPIRQLTYKSAQGSARRLDRGGEVDPPADPLPTISQTSGFMTRQGRRTEYVPRTGHAEPGDLHRDVPTALLQAERHADWEDEPPGERLEAGMDKDEVAAREGRVDLLGRVMMLVPAEEEACVRRHGQSVGADRQRGRRRGATDAPESAGRRHDCAPAAASAAASTLPVVSAPRSGCCLPLGLAEKEGDDFRAVLDVPLLKR